MEQQETFCRVRRAAIHAKDSTAVLMLDVITALIAGRDRRYLAVRLERRARNHHQRRVVRRVRVFYGKSFSKSRSPSTTFPRS